MDMSLNGSTPHDMSWQGCLLSGGCLPQGDQRCDATREGYCCTCPGKPNQHAKKAARDESRDGCGPWAGQRSVPAGRGGQQQVFPQSSVPGIFYTSPGALGTGEGFGWKLARRQVNAGLDRTAVDARQSSVADSGQPAVSSAGRCVVNSYASSQCHVASQAVHSEMSDSGSKSLAGCSPRSSISTTHLSHSFAQEFARPSRCPETEGITPKPYSHVLPQGQAANTQVFSVNSCHVTPDSKGLADTQADTPSSCHATQNSLGLADRQVDSLCSRLATQDSTGLTDKQVCSLCSCHATQDGTGLADTQVYSLSPCHATPESKGLAGARLPMTEAAFAEQIACSSIGFQPESFHKYWNDSSREDDEGGKWEAATETCFPGSADGSSTSVLLKSLQLPQDVNSTALPSSAHACPDNRSPGKKRCVDCTTGESFNLQSGNNPRGAVLQNEQAVMEKEADYGTPTGFNPPNLVGPGPFKNSAKSSAHCEGRRVEDKQTDRAGQVPHNWIPLSTFTLHCPPGSATPDLPPADCKQESRLVQCYSVNVAASTGGQQAADYGVTEPDAAGLANPNLKSCALDDSRLSSVVGLGVGSEALGAGTAATGGGLESAVSGATTDATDGRKTARKDRILEEISAWFIDNHG